MRQMAMVGSGCSACHSFTGHCPHEAPPWAGCSQHQVTILLRALHSAPSKKLNLLPRPYDLACLPPRLHLPSATPSLPQSPWPPLRPHMKLPSQGFCRYHFPHGSTVLLSCRAPPSSIPTGLPGWGSSPITLSVLGFICLHITLGQANIYFIATFSVSP